jgi:F-type H+-transporting ATPase subunit epsilon
MFKYKILIPSACLFGGEATMVVLPGVKGELGILEGHINFFSILKAGIVRVFKENVLINQYFVEGGIVKIRKDILIFTEEALELSQLKPELVRVRFENACKALEKDPLNSVIIKEHEIARLLLHSLNVTVQD